MYYNIVVPKNHPRIYATNNLKNEIRSRMEHPFYENIVKLMKEQSKENSLQAALCNGFYYFLYKEEELGKKAIAILNSILKRNLKIKEKSDYIRENGCLLHGIGLIYDWCYDLIEEKEFYIQAIEKLVDGLENIYKKIEWKDIIINYSETQLLRDITVAYLAIYDEKKELFEKWNQSILQEYIQLRNFTASSQGYPQGTGFGATRACFDMHLNWLFKRMDNPDVFAETMGVEPYYLIYLKRPDGYLFHDGDKLVIRDIYGNPGVFPKILMHAASFYKDEVLNQEFLNQLSGVNFKKDELSVNYINPLEMILFYDNHVGCMPLKSLPLTKFFPQPIGAMVCRSGWNMGKESEDFVCYFKLGIYNYGFHQHLDSGQFQIYYKGYLAIDSGGYSKLFHAHDLNYHKRTIAHNCMTFLKPREKMKYRGRSVSNDGGQVYFGDLKSSFNVMDMFERGQKLGKFINKAIVPDHRRPKYCHIRGLNDDAYGTKVNMHSRSFLYIRTDDERCPAIVVVVDRMKVRFKKTYVLHSKEKPRVLFNHVIIKDIGNGYNGRLINTTVFPLPDDLNIETYGGKYNEFYVDSVNFPVDLSDKQTQEQEIGAYRVEISSLKNDPLDIYFNVLQVTDGDSEFIYEVLPSIEEQKAVCVDKYKIYYLNEQCYEYQILTTREGLTHFVILNARLGYYSVKSKDGSYYTQCECRNNFVEIILPKGEYLVERIIM